MSTVIDHFVDEQGKVFVDKSEADGSDKIIIKFRQNHNGGFEDINIFMTKELMPQLIEQLEECLDGIS